MDERENYVSRFNILLERFAEVVESIPDDRIDERAIETGSSPAIIVSHVLGSVSGSVLGIACDREIYRNREEEFQVTGVPASELASKLRDLAREIEASLGASDAPPFDEVVVPTQSLLGLQQPREMQRREPVVGSLAHAAEHLGELQLVRDLMAQGR